MRWSAVKRNAELFLADPLVGRISYFLTSYQKGKENFGRGWITFNGDEIASFPGGEDGGERQRFYEAVSSVSQRSIEEMIQDESNIVRMLALFDRRFGARRLDELREEELSDPLEIIGLRIRKAVRKKREVAAVANGR